MKKKEQALIKEKGSKHPSCEEKRVRAKQLIVRRNQSDVGEEGEGGGCEQREHTERTETRL